MRYTKNSFTYKKHIWCNFFSNTFKDNIAQVPAVIDDTLLKPFTCMLPGTIEQLKEAIWQEVVTIPPAMTRKAMDNFCEQLQECVIDNGRHLSDVIFKSVWKKIASYVLFISKRIFCVPRFVWFLLTFKMWESFLLHPVLTRLCSAKCYAFLLALGITDRFSIKWSSLPLAATVRPVTRKLLRTVSCKTK